MNYVLVDKWGIALICAMSRAECEALAEKMNLAPGWRVIEC